MSALEKAKARRTELLKELARVEQFISDHAAFERGEYSPARRQRKPFIRGQKDEVLNQIIAVLDGSLKPLRTCEIAERIQQGGYQIQAQNPTTYVGTIIHRNQDKIERTKQGSRLRGVAQ